MKAITCKRFLKPLIINEKSELEQKICSLRTKSLQNTKSETS